MRDGAHMTLSAIHTTLHLGAHADAPNHYAKDGHGIGAQDLEPYYGPCQVVQVQVAAGQRISPADVQTPITQPRVLFYTGSYPNPDQFNEDYVSLSPELVHWLNDQGVRLVGIDTPSVDPFASKALESHNALADTHMANLEGLVLSRADAGEYQLIALPLPLQGADASPVRAVLAPLA